MVFKFINSIKSSNKSLKLMMFVLLGSLLLVSFQNCIPNKINTQTVQSQNSVNSGNGQGYDGLTSGNGQGYDGKMNLLGAYYHWLPNYACNLAGIATSSYEKSIIYNSTGIPMLTSDLCTKSNSQLSPSETESYAFNSNFLLYQGQALERTTGVSPSARGYISLFCHSGYFMDILMLTGTNVVIRQKLNPSTYSAEIYYGELSVVSPATYLSYQVTPFAVSYDKRMDNVVYSASGFSLNVSLVNPAQRYFPPAQTISVYSAQYTATINQVAVSAQLMCYFQ